MASVRGKCQETLVYKAVYLAIASRLASESKASKANG